MLPTQTHHTQARHPYHHKSTLPTPPTLARIMRHFSNSPKQKFTPAAFSDRKV